MIGFYHCTRTPALTVAVQLATRAFESGNRLLIVAEPEAAATLDQRLWTDDAASFIPHGLADGPEPEAQPILIAAAADAPPANGARWAMFVSLPLPDDAPDRFERIFLLFEEGAPAQEAARSAWRRLKSRADRKPSYWQQRGGRWVAAG